MSEDFFDKNAIEFGRIYSHNDKWKFEAIGSGYSGGFQSFVYKYIG